MTEDTNPSRNRRARVLRQFPPLDGPLSTSYGIEPSKRTELSEIMDTLLAIPTIGLAHARMDAVTDRLLETILCSCFSVRISLEASMTHKPPPLTLIMGTETYLMGQLNDNLWLENPSPGSGNDGNSRLRSEGVAKTSARCILSFRVALRSRQETGEWRRLALMLSIRRCRQKRPTCWLPSLSRPMMPSSQCS